MATARVTISDLMADWDYDVLLSLLSWDRASCQALLKCHSGLITNSIMLSQTAADVHVFFEVFVRSYCIIDFRSRVRMKKVIERIVERGNYHHVSIFLDYLRRSLDSGDYDCIQAIILRGERAVEGLYKNETCDGALPSQHSQHAFTVAVAAVLHLLAIVFQYLIGYIDRGGTKTYSSGCFDFRASFVSVLLFLAAFVWIKFRQAARPPTGKRKARSTQLDHPGEDDSYDRSRFCVRGEKFEARYTIPKDRVKAHPVKHPRLTLGLHETREKAAFVSRVAQSYYEEQRGACYVSSQFEVPVPPMSEEERALVGEEKRQWVMKQVKDVGTKMYEAWAKQQIPVATGAGSSNPSSSLSFQPSLMRSQTADEPLHVLDFPSCPGLPCEETVREMLNRGSQPLQEQHQGPAQEHPFEEVPPIDGRQPDFTGEDISNMIASIPPNSESAPIPGNDAFPYFGAGADAVEHGRPEPLPQGIIGAGDAVLNSAGFGPTVIERSESLDLDGHMTYSESAPIPEMMPHSGVEAVEQGPDPQFEPPRNFQQGMCDGNPVQQNGAFESAVGEQSESEQQTIVQQQQQQPQAYVGEFFQDLEHQQGSESQNPGLQQVHTPSQQISDHLVEEDPSSKTISILLEICSKHAEENQHLLELIAGSSEDNERLRKEKELCEQEIERLQKEKELSDEEKELSDEEKERLQKEKELSEQENQRLRKEKELCEQENERLRKEKELSDEEKELCEQENERLRKEKELSDEEKERLRKEKELSEQDNERLRKKMELSDEEKERLREEIKRLSDAIVVLVAPKSK